MSRSQLNAGFFMQKLSPTATLDSPETATLDTPEYNFEPFCSKNRTHVYTVNYSVDLP